MSRRFKVSVVSGVVTHLAAVFGFGHYYTFTTLITWVGHRKPLLSNCDEDAVPFRRGTVIYPYVDIVKKSSRLAYSPPSCGFIFLSFSRGATCS